MMTALPRRTQYFALLVTLLLTGCISLQRAAHMYSNEAPSPLTFNYQAGGSSHYYHFSIGNPDLLDTVVFFYGATGCPSWKSVMPAYVDGLNINAQVFVLNKRFVADRSLGLFDCGQAFHLANNPGQWVADYREFIRAQIAQSPRKPRQVVLVGVSEGAIPASKIATQLPEITHLALIGSGGYSMRQSLNLLKQKGSIAFDVNSGWEKIASDPRSIEKQWYGNTYRWWSEIMDIDPSVDLIRLNIPILIGMGEQDQSVPVESALALEQKFKAAGKSNLVVRVYPGADHRLNAPGVSYRPQFFAELSKLLKQPN